MDGGSDGKASVYSTGDLGSSPGLGRSPGEGNGNLLQYSCLENSMDRGGWKSIAHGITKSWSRPSYVHSLTNKVLDSDGFFGKLYQIFKEETSILHKLFQKIEKE